MKEAALTLYKTQNTQALLRGSVITLRRKCGKSNCQCSQAEPHQTPALSYSLRGATRILTLRPQDLREVRAALVRYRKALHQLDRQALAGIQQLRQRIEKEKTQARQEKKR